MLECMKRRRLFIALAVILTVAIFVAAKLATRWRPVEVTRFDTSNWSTDSVEVSRNFVAVGDKKLDLHTGAQTDLDGQILGVGTWTWQRVTDSKIQGYLSLDDAAGHKRRYELPGIGGEWDVTPVGPIVRYTPNADRLEMISNGAYYRWKWQSRQLERTVKLEYSEDVALARDGETLIYPRESDIATLSTRTGKITRRVPLQGGEFFESVRLSPSGIYALYEAPDHFFTQHVVDARTGRALWDAKMDNNNRDAIFAPDETLLAVPQAQRKIWEIRALPGGHILRTIPFVPNLDAAAFSPDNSTLYSVAGGVLYRQRAR